ncbi:hypothetical protein ERO13_D07G096300v2 [Gossypium hirsutum]|uniref:Uncharacterized protein n=5 Tax=Gossypium TaxID=3633 RepID=A0A1U8PBR0_GOSHI|nr:uncharacterized protein LOC107956610 [Gossypium hirsutum]KAB2020908.1 hypothetical protein ES319_D07G102300v1 [Gossypium barbadense]KJB08786.1 hypothetical protein B456_001G103600 [Gossypium raimondii]TYG60927.1 hypothetical protein ES288_D07G107100v1 [Gossypium darwinii]TYH62248.1 hypothetical protein ES332_D07G107100v1 [Gossypium tomentosum]KAG4137831.1 hypothetical protein ERO13_D07G096300v2 [Gossypium hirsutum]
MLVLLLKFVFSLVTTLSNLVTRSIFIATAYVLVVLIQAFKVPGEALQVALEKLADAIKVCFEYFFEMIVELMGSLISTVFDSFVDAVTTSASVSGEAVGILVEKTRMSLQELLTGLPEIAEGFSEMVSTVVTDLWNNCMQALGYVTENA